MLETQEKFPIKTVIRRKDAAGGSVRIEPLAVYHNVQKGTFDVRIGSKVDGRSGPYLKAFKSRGDAIAYAQLWVELFRSIAPASIKTYTGSTMRPVCPRNLGIDENREICISRDPSQDFWWASDRRGEDGLWGTAEEVYNLCGEPHDVDREEVAALDYESRTSENQEQQLDKLYSEDTLEPAIMRINTEIEKRESLVAQAKEELDKLSIVLTGLAHEIEKLVGARDALASL